MKNSIENNLKKWNDEYGWGADGDEWNGQSRVSGQPYPEWKVSIVKTFIEPNLGPNVVVLEIAPGHGRWTREMIGRCRELFLVDLSPTALSFAAMPLPTTTTAPILSMMVRVFPASRTIMSILSGRSTRSPTWTAPSSLLISRKLSAC